jgi:1-phosphatidylinositol-3-phosphate 5-kinase
MKVEEMDEPLPRSPVERSKDDEVDVTSMDEDEDVDKPIATWTLCQMCNKVVTPLRFISEHTWKFSFGKFLEVQFYNRDAILNAPGQGCNCNVQAASRLYFGCGKLAARFTYERVSPMGVFVRKTLPLDITFHKAEAIDRLEIISVASSKLFVNFDKHIEKVSREARSLFTTATNRPENLQTVLSELNRIGSEVDHAAKTLQEKIASVSDSIRRSDDSTINSALFRFPAFARRYLFNLTNSWNEKLSAAGQAISAMKKIAAAASNRGDVGTNVAANVSDPNNDELAEGMKRLRELMEHYDRYNVTDITQVLPAVPESTEIVQDGEYDDEFDDPDASIDFADGDIDADVLASRRRLQSIKQSGLPCERNKTSDPKPTKALGTRRSLTDIPRPSPEAAVPKPTPGGAVKSAITRFFNRGGRDYDQYVVKLGIFAEGRPRLSPGVNGVVVPVLDDQFSTIIAFSLASTEYSKQFKHFLKSDNIGTTSLSTGTMERSRKSDSLKVDLDAGVGGEGNMTMQQPNLGPAGTDGKEIERQLLDRNKSHIKHTFRDVDEKGQVACKFVCTSYWAVQFHAVRQSFLASEDGSRSGEEIEQNFIESLSSAYSWAASGGKSGASFARTSDDRFVIKCISRTELQMFLDCAPAYFEYLSKAFFHGL